ncbi:DnaA ATPase domain-containing protein [Henriciella aquimarina]|uniref:DnaA ATPase domain-containing protein n=1 Tax=Henriciella aquimarina TaxID=545261 RepID=UPI0009FC15D7|nr:DnaA/Hda family protein [Henriciella aquimarina]
MGLQEESSRRGEDNQKGKTGKDIHRGRDIWIDVLNDTKTQTSAEDFDKWISDLRFVAEVDDEVVIAARDQLAFDRINSNHRPMLKRIWRKADPKGRALRITCWKDIPASTRDLVDNPWAAELKRPAKVTETASTDRTTLEPGMTFATLIVGDTNKRAVGLAQEIVAGGKRGADVSLIYGRQGTGKTHILRAIEGAVAHLEDGRRVTYMTAEEFMTAFVDGARAGDTRDLKTQVRDNDLLLIDDLQWIAGKQKTDDAFFANIRSVTKKGGRVVLTADEAPGDLKGFSQRMRGELLGAAATEVGLPDQEMRREIVRLHAAMIRQDQPNFELDEEMIEKIVSTVRGPGRELCGVLWSLQTETGYGEDEPDMEMLVTVLRRQQGEYQAPSLDNIKRATMRAFGLSKTEIESANKSRTICYPRQIAMYLCREMTDKSYPQVARAFSKKDHTTVLHAWRKVKKALQSDPDMVRDVERVREMVFEIQAEGN